MGQRRTLATGFMAALLAGPSMAALLAGLPGCLTEAAKEARKAAEAAAKGAEIASENALKASNEVNKASQEITKAATQIKEVNPAVQVERLSQQIVLLERQLQEARQRNVVNDLVQSELSKRLTAPVWLIYRNGIKAGKGVKRVEVVSAVHGHYRVHFDGEFDGREYAAVGCWTDSTKVDHFEQKERTSIVVVITGPPEFDISLTGTVFREAASAK